MIVLISSFALILAGVILTLLPSSLNRVKYILGIILLAYLSIISIIAFINGDFISLEIGEGIFRNVLTITPNALIIQIVSAIAGVLILVASSNSYIKGRDISGTAVLTYGFMAGLLFSESGLYFLIFLLLLNIGIWRLSDRDRIELNMSASDRVFMVRMPGWFVMLIGLISLHFSGDLSTYIPFRLGNSAFSSFLILFGLLAQGGIFPFQFWLGDKTDCHPGGCALINTVFASFPVLYGLMVLMGSINVPEASVIASMVFVILTIVICSGISAIISDTERVLGYSTAVFNSIAFMLILIGGNMEYELALWLLTLHIGGKLLFYFVMMAKDELEITRDMRQSEGLLKNYPLLSASSLFGAVFLIPLAPFTGLILFEPVIASFSGKFWLLGLLLAISIFLIIGHLIRLVRGNLWGSKHKKFAPKKKYPKTINIAIYIDIVMLILLTFIIFLSPKLINWFI